MIRIVWAGVDALEPEAALPLLSDYRRRSLARLKDPRARRESAGAELLLLHALRELRPALRPPLDIRTGENGKPCLADGGLSFSLSHSGGRALCALSDRELGADIQARRSFDQRLARRFFAPEELAYILAAPDRDGAFTQVWALKESYAKALGLGLRLPLSSFSVIREGRIGIEGWDLRAWEAEGFSLAVCAPDGDGAAPVKIELDREAERLWT